MAMAETAAPKSSALTLYEIETDLMAWQDTLELAESPEANAEIQARVTDYLNLAMEKRDRFTDFLKHLAHLEEAAKVEEQRMKKRREGFERVRERLEGYAVHTMETLKVKKLDGHISTLTLRKNPDSVDIVDAALIPAEFKRTPPPPAPVPDKVAIKKALDSGQVVPGADLKFGRNRLEVR